MPIRTASSPNEEAAKFRPRDVEGRRDEGRTEEGRPLAGWILERLKAQDKDNDGRVSRQEFDGPERRFDRLDADKDNFISQDEAAQFQGRQRRRARSARLRPRQDDAQPDSSSR